MQKQVGNSCTRCGQQRVVLKTWKEYVGQSLIIRTATVCPNPECQKLVDKDLADQKEKRELLASKKAQSKQARIGITLSPKRVPRA